MANLKTIYEPTGERVEPDVWGSGGFSSGIGFDKDKGRGIQKPGRFFSQKDCEGIEYAKEHGYEAKVIKPIGYNLKNPKEREAYFDVVFDWALQEPPKVIALSGFNLIIPPTVFDRLDKENILMLNVHPGNLALQRLKNGSILNAGNEDTAKIHYMTEAGEAWRAYVGNDAVYDAMVGGETELMATIHKVTPGTDAGPIFTRKPRARKVDAPFVKRCINYGDFEALEQYKDTFQGHMKTECDVPAYLNTFNILYHNKIEIDPATETLFFNGKKQPYGGILMDAELKKIGGI
ncbi:hypothetical protein L6303_00765 [archaeon]|nr:hypothetical protein [Nanoarchaeota archaeon]MBU4300910.1 hypothetical protein [Nanoarchaeota archaeon]MBU4451752.1 hypothetical protein [Nanoarchaeota archaeon]MCG2723257.1 hypothetical protein [archaeon]